MSYQCYNYINKLFHLEKEYKKHGYTYEEIEKKRKEEARPIVEKLYKIVKEGYSETLPTGLLKKALVYTINQEEKLRTYLTDGRIEISNNGCENAIRPFAVGRKNWLFCNTAKGAEGSGVLYSMVETAKANNLKVYNYIEYLMEKLKDMDIRNRTEVEKVLPWSKELPKELYK